LKEESEATTRVIIIRKSKNKTNTSVLLSIFSRVCVARSLVFCVVYCRSLFVLFRIAIMLSNFPFFSLGHCSVLFFDLNKKWNLLQINHIFSDKILFLSWNVTKKTSKTTRQLTDVFRSTLCYSQVFVIFSVTCLQFIMHIIVRRAIFCQKIYDWFVGGLISYLRYLSLLTYSGVQHISCCVFVVFVFVLYLEAPYVTPRFL
jgi:hypothetical protein